MNFEPNLRNLKHIYPVLELKLKELSTFTAETTTFLIFYLYIRMHNFISNITYVTLKQTCTN